MDPATGIKTNVLYFTAPNEEFPAFVRRVTFTNEGTEAVELEVVGASRAWKTLDTPAQPPQAHTRKAHTRQHAHASSHASAYTYHTPAHTTTPRHAHTLVDEVGFDEGCLWL